MAEFELPYYCGGDIGRVSDRDMIDILKDIIDQVMIENRTYYDNDDRAMAVEVIYPVISSIVFNSNFAHIRGNEKAIEDLTQSLVARLS